MQVAYLEQDETFEVFRNADTQQFHCDRCGRGYADPVSLQVCRGARFYGKGLTIRAEPLYGVHLR